jgi:hypothetical protein
MPKKLPHTKPKKVAVGKSVFDDRGLLEQTRQWIVDYYCCRCTKYSKSKNYCTECDNRSA